MSSESLLPLHRRWRLRSASPGAFWGIYDFTPSDEREALLVGLQLHPLSELLARPCLFLLGRPGSGKTAEFQMHFLPDKLPAEFVIALEARHLDGAGAESIFSGTEWQDALNAGKPIRLVLDSVDEALLGRGTFLDGLIRHLGLAKAAAERRNLSLSVVLTCRPEWSDKKAQEIADLWLVSAQDCTYELAPLSRDAALTLAKSKGVKNQQEFAKAWALADMEAYACWPRTLIWLATEYARNGAISSTITALHERRCSWQFEDERLERHGDKLTPEKLALWSEEVELLAAGAIATGAQRFVMGGPAGEKELDVSTLGEMMAKLPGRRVIGPPAFVEALKFGNLFARVGDAWVFQEQSDAEFLAARRLARLPVEQLADFFGTYARHGWEVFPQLSASAAMAAVHSDDFRKWLLEHDPLVLLRTDFAALTTADKEVAVEAFLNLIESGNAPDAHQQESRLQTLAHRNLAAQLRPWLHDSTRSLDARGMALRIAAACADETLKGELAEDIWQLATGAEADILSWLPLAISAMGVRWSKERLLTFAKGQVPAGPHWDSKGAALYALFDRSRSTLQTSEQAKLSEVFPFLYINPTGVWSLYDSFLHSCHEYFRPEDGDEVCKLLKALEQWIAPLDSGGPIRKLAFAVLGAASSHIPEERVTAALADWWFWVINQGNYQIPGQYNTTTLAEIGLDDPERRHALLAVMFRHPLAAKLNDHQLLELPSVPEDYPWLLARLPDSADVEEKVIARLVARRIYNRALREKHLPVFRTGYWASAELRSLLPPAPDGDIHAELTRLEDEQERRWAAESAKVKPQMKNGQEYDAEKALVEALERCRNGDEKSWPWILEAIAFLGSKPHEGRLWETGEPGELPGWQRISTADRPIVIQAARAYLLHRPPNLPERNQSHLGVEATRHALALLRTQLLADAELRAAFRPDWVDIVLRALYPNRAPLPDVLATLMALDARSTLGRIRSQLDYDWTENRFMLAEYLDPVWSPDVQAMLEDVLSLSPVQTESYRTGITCLLRHDRESAAAFALHRCEKLAAAPPGNGRRVAIGTALLAFPECWRQVWPLIVADPQEGINCLAWVASAWEHLGWFKAMLGADERGKHAEFISVLYGWLQKHLPPEPKGRTSYTPDGIDFCRDIERKCHEALVEMGCSDLLAAAYDFAGVAGQPWTQRVVRKADRNALASEWRPWSHTDFAEWMISEGGTRISDKDSLLRAVETSLRRFGQAWKKMPPTRLWNLEKREPRREKALSDELKMHLEQDLRARIVPRRTPLFINREPEFFSGEQTDLHIQACLPDGSTATVIVEVKLCDHPEVGDSMKTQLAERYLRQKGLTHGIYFVGWFACGAWPKRKCPFQRQGEAKARRALEKQAATLSSAELRIRAVLVPFPWHSKREHRSKKAPPIEAEVRTSA